MDGTLNNGSDAQHLLSVSSDEIKELRKMAEALFWAAKTSKDERLAVILMKILGAGAQQSAKASAGQS